MIGAQLDGSTLMQKVRLEVNQINTSLKGEAKTLLLFISFHCGFLEKHCHKLGPSYNS